VLQEAQAAQALKEPQEALGALAHKAPPVRAQQSMPQQLLQERFIQYLLLLLVQIKLQV
jgi:hypothetical protein